jgi:hypothetical protein
MITKERLKVREKAHPQCGALKFMGYHREDELAQLGLSPHY